MATVPNGTVYRPTASTVKRVNLNLSEKAYSDLQLLSVETNHSMTEIIRLGLGLVKVAVNEARNGNKLAVLSNDGRPLKEIVLPS